MADKNGLGKLAVISLISAAAGAIAGILYAPQSGEKTRKELAKQANRLAEQGSDLADSAVKQATKHAKRVHKQVKKLAK